MKKNIIRTVSAGILGLASLFIAFSPEFGSENVKAKDDLLNANPSSLVAELPEFEFEDNEEEAVEAASGVVAVANTASSGYIQYRTADVNYAAAPKTHDTETSASNQKAIEQAKQDDIAYEEAVEAKKDVAEKELKVEMTEEAKQEEKDNKSETVIIKDDGSLVTDQSDQNNGSIVADNREIVDLGTIDFGDESTDTTVSSSDANVSTITTVASADESSITEVSDSTGTIMVASISDTPAVASDASLTSSDGSLEVVISSEDTEESEESPIIIGQDVVTMVA